MATATWRYRTEHDAPLPDLDSSRCRLPGSQRCQVTGLYRGDCQQTRRPFDHLCYYHAKLRDGLLEPADLHYGVEGPTGTGAYPVWPLPKRPFVLLSASELAA